MIDTFGIMKVQVQILIYYKFCIFLISGHYERQFRTQSQSLFNDDYDKHTAPPKLIEGKKNIFFKHSGKSKNGYRTGWSRPFFQKEMAITPIRSSFF